MFQQVTNAKLVLIAGAVAVAPVAANVISADIHWDLTSVVVALITGIFGTIQIWMLRSLHTMVNSQQSSLNEIARRDAMNAAGQAGEERGRLKGRDEAEAAAAKVALKAVIDEKR